jgi:hypothetical protein
MEFALLKQEGEFLVGWAEGLPIEVGALRGARPAHNPFFAALRPNELRPRRT